jgi:ribosomal protein S18 acetylase RimI-like enzyme
MIEIVPAPVQHPSAQALLTAYFEERARSFPADQGSYRTTFPDPAQFVRPQGEFFLVLQRGEPVGCGGIRRIADAGGPGSGTRVRFEVKHLWLDPAARGSGHGRALLRHLEDVATDLGADEVVLDTNASLTAAGSLYRSNGYSEIAPYNDNPNATHWFGKPVYRR